MRRAKKSDTHSLFSLSLLDKTHDAQKVRLSLTFCRFYSLFECVTSSLAQQSNALSRLLSLHFLAAFWTPFCCSGFGAGRKEDAAFCTYDLNCSLFLRSFGAHRACTLPSTFLYKANTACRAGEICTSPHDAQSFPASIL